MDLSEVKKYLEIDGLRIDDATLDLVEDGQVVKTFLLILGAKKDIEIWFHFTPAGVFVYNQYTKDASLAQGKDLAWFVASCTPLELAKAFLQKEWDHTVVKALLRERKESYRQQYQAWWDKKNEEEAAYFHANGSYAGFVQPPLPDPLLLPRDWRTGASQQGLWGVTIIQAIGHMLEERLSFLNYEIFKRCLPVYRDEVSGQWVLAFGEDVRDLGYDYAP